MLVFPGGASANGCVDVTTKAADTGNAFCLLTKKIVVEFLGAFLKENPRLDSLIRKNPKTNFDFLY